jgi:8-oxo-dGTP pyrophosphatase MutT (NUDIX family)
MSKKKRVRPLAICIFRSRDRILVMEGYDPLKKEYFYRPLGGGIEFGESGAETVCREIMEEINVEVDRQSLTYLGALENIFTYNGEPGHEIVLIYDGALKEPGLYERAAIVGQEADGEEFRAIWKNISEFSEGNAILYPTGLVELLNNNRQETVK